MDPEIRERVEAGLQRYSQVPPVGQIARLQRYSQVPPVGQIARRLGLMDADGVLRVLNHQQTSGQFFCVAAVSLGIISDADAERLLAEQRRLRAAAGLDDPAP